MIYGCDSVVWGSDTWKMPLTGWKHILSTASSLQILVWAQLCFGVLILHSFALWVCVCTCQQACVEVRGQRTEVSSEEWFLSFNRVDKGGWTQVVRRGSRHPYRGPIPLGTLLWNFEEPQSSMGPHAVYRIIQVSIETLLVELPKEWEPLSGFSSSFSFREWPSHSLSGNNFKAPMSQTLWQDGIWWHSLINQLVSKGSIQLYLILIFEFNKLVNF